MPGYFLELVFFIRPDIAEFAFWKTIHKERFVFFAKKNNAAITFGLAFSGAGNTLFDNAPTEVRINLAFFSSLHSIPQRRGPNLFFSGKTGKPRIFENSQVQDFRITILIL